MWRILLTIAGMLIAIAGVVWTLQGLGYIKGSVMTGVTLWVMVGPLIALCGLAVTVTGLRRSWRAGPVPRLIRLWSGGAA